uniref:Uncharacterized protein n=1 Tax=Amphimedon queenslandica TaxID=400682 RepID=A0A1X7UTP1_AMPQE
AFYFHCSTCTVPFAIIMTANTSFFTKYNNDNRLPMG